MLKIFICPKCYNYRIVSRNPTAKCFHCGALLRESNIDYIEYTNMSGEQRSKYKDEFIKRMKLYNEKINNEKLNNDIE